MSFDQVAILVLLGGMLVVFAVDRWRMELVALAGLGLGFALGLVPADEVFAGFADPAVVTVVEILLIVQVLSRVALLDRVQVALDEVLDRLLLVLRGIVLPKPVFESDAMGRLEAAERQLEVQVIELRAEELGDFGGGVALDQIIRHEVQDGDERGDVKMRRYRHG